ncbi:1660_t:CDS:2 [Ambispora leptoticha]|uniref:1660_t:CDS:1 n=1 Tax=Ambispora leptoticha TaxID=144679 RepID=A0A9N9BQV3_9GLOM|nr:1660_t:CDS:2 [Ambispora leptoticha]
MDKKVIIPENKKVSIEELSYFETGAKDNQKVVKKVKEKGQQASQKKPLLVLISGGVASGKTTLTQQAKEYFEKSYQGEVITLSIDAYYTFSPLLFHLRNPNLSEVFQWEELNKDLELLSAGKSIYLPIYDDSEGRRFTRSNGLIKSSSVVIVEGIFTLFYEEIREKSDLRVYIEVDDDLRLVRRLERYNKGLKEGKFNKPVKYEIARYKTQAKKNQENFVEPTKRYADLIVNNNSLAGSVKEVLCL